MCVSCTQAFCEPGRPDWGWSEPNSSPSHKSVDRPKLTVSSRIQAAGSEMNGHRKQLILLFDGWRLTGNERRVFKEQLLVDVRNDQFFHQNIVL